MSDGFNADSENVRATFTKPRAASRWLLRRGMIATSAQRALVRADVLIEDGKITAVGTDLQPEGKVETIDCSGKILMPGLFDAHVHARQPGQEHKETIATCAEAAINGGVTGMVLMPNTVPAIDSANLVRTVLDLGKQTNIDVYTSGCITKDRAGQDLAAIGSMKEAGVVMLTDDGNPVENPRVLRLAMEYARDFDLMLASHCETMSLTNGGSMHEGAKSFQLGLRGIPALSEELCLARDIQIAKFTGARLHIQHVTTKEGMETIWRAKQDGVKVTCEVAPHHLMFTDDDIGDYDTHYKMNPPLRRPEDINALLDGLKSGKFDLIATDHAPHSPVEKAKDFGSAPFGITGLETALVSLYDRFISKGEFDWDLIVNRYADEPRRLVGLDPVSIREGETADLLVFDPEADTTFTSDFMRSKSQNTPFLNQTLKGCVTHVLKGNQLLLER